MFELQLINYRLQIRWRNSVTLLMQKLYTLVCGAGVAVATHKCSFGNGITIASFINSAGAKEGSMEVVV